LLYDTGAYSDFFASNANAFPRPAKIMVAGDGTPRLLAMGSSAVNRAVLREERAVQENPIIRDKLDIALREITLR
jgi:hypothetical protein